MYVGFGSLVQLYLSSFWTYIGCNMHATITSIHSRGFHACKMQWKWFSHWIKKDKNGSFTFDANSAAALVLFKCESVKRVQNWSVYLLNDDKITSFPFFILIEKNPINVGPFMALTTNGAWHFLYFPSTSQCLKITQKSRLLLRKFKCDILGDF